MLVAVGTPYEVTVVTLDGASVQGTIAEWNESELVLSSGDESTDRIPRSEIARIDFSKADSSEIDPPELLVSLEDGSIVPADGCEVNGADAEFVSPFGESGGSSTWKSSTERMRAIRFDRSDSGQDEAWLALVGRERTGDWLVVYKKKSATLDYIEGIIERITSESLTILLDDEPVTVPLEKVFGVVFYHRTKDASPESPLRIEGQRGMSLVGREIRLNPERVEIDLAGGGTIAVHPRVIRSIVFSSDRILSLSDLELSAPKKNWQPFFTIPADSPLLATWGLPRKNRSFSGEPLQLLVRDSLGRSIVREFERGLAMRSRSEATFSIPTGYKSLSLLAGMDPAAHANSEAILLVELDGQSVGEWRIARREPAQTIEIDVTGKQRLRFLVDYGSGTDAGDVVHLCQPRLIK